MNKICTAVNFCWIAFKYILFLGVKPNLTHKSSVAINMCCPGLEKKSFLLPWQEEASQAVSPNLHLFRRVLESLKNAWHFALAGRITINDPPTEGNPFQMFSQGFLLVTSYSLCFKWGGDIWTVDLAVFLRFTRAHGPPKPYRVTIAKCLHLIPFTFRPNRYRFRTAACCLCGYWRRPVLVAWGLSRHVPHLSWNICGEMDAGSDFFDKAECHLGTHWKGEDQHTFI